MAVRDKGSLTHFERADGKIVKIKSASQQRHQVKSTIITQNGAQPSCNKPTVHQENEQQQSCSRLQHLATNLDKCVVERPRSLIQGGERITLESVHHAKAAEASSTWRGEGEEGRIWKTLRKRFREMRKSLRKKEKRK